MNANTELNKLYYNEVIDDICGCKYCKFYLENVKDHYPMLNEYLSNLGIDISRPHEISLPYLNSAAEIEYSYVQYISLGTCDYAYSEKIGDVTISKAQSYPATNIDREHFVIEISALTFNQELADKGFIE